MVNDVGAGDSFLAGYPARTDELSVANCLARATAVAAARCETDRPWNLNLSAHPLWNSRSFRWWKK